MSEGPSVVQLKPPRSEELAEIFEARLMPKRTPSGKKTAVADVEEKLKERAAAKGMSSKRAAAYTYGTLNKIGLMRGSKTTAKGAKAAKSKRKAKR